MSSMQDNAATGARSGHCSLTTTAVVTLTGFVMGLTIAGDAHAKPRTGAHAAKHVPANAAVMTGNRARTNSVPVANGSTSPGGGRQTGYKIVEEHTGMQIAGSPATTRTMQEAGPAAQSSTVTPPK